MGCDIHIMAEVKRNGRWEKNTDAVFENPWWDPERTDWEMAKDQYVANPPDGRNYDWFSVLADVRNGRGFAGVRTGEGFNIISEPKGVPDDASPEWLELVREWDCDMHSKSWLTIDELESFDWNQTTRKEGVIPLEHYSELRSKPNATPESWSGFVSGKDVIIVDRETADAILDIDPSMPLVKPEEDGFKESVYKGLSTDAILEAIMDGTPASEFKVQVKYYWDVEYREWFKWNIENIIEPLRKLANLYGDARIVFGFDN